MLARLSDVFRCLSARDVHYVVIGGVAAIIHGVPRTTFVVDLLIEATPDNAARLLAALQDAGIASASLTTAEGVLAREITVFKDVLRIDVQTRTPGVDFPSAWLHRLERQVDGVGYWIVSREHLIAMKTATGRPKDLEDVRVLSRPDGA